LDGTTDLEVVGAERLHGLAFVGVPCRINRHAPATQIDAKDAQSPCALRRRRFHLDVQEESAIATLDERGTGRLLALEARFLMLSRCGVKVLGVGATRRSPLLKMR
jgi:hypothetical protein